LALLFLNTFTACAQQKAPVQSITRQERVSAPEPLRQPREATESAPVEPLITTKKDYSGVKTRFSSTPKLTQPPQAKVIPPQTKSSDLGQERQVTINFENMSLPAFINGVYGDILKMSFQMAPEIQKKTDLVTLRVPDPTPADAVDRLTRQVLRKYGVAVESQGEILFFGLGKGAPPQGELPFIVSGRTLPDVPASHRPIFQLVPLKVVSNTQVVNWLKEVYKGQQVTVYEDPERNAVMLMGNAEVIREAVEAVLILDQPFMRGLYSVRIEPAFLNAQDLSTQLIAALSSEGYSASSTPSRGGIIVFPIVPAGAVLAFAADPQFIAHIKEWAETLDRPGRGLGMRGIFYYRVKNTRAYDIAKVLDRLLVENSPENALSAMGTNTTQSQTSQAVQQGSILKTGFQGSQKDKGQTSSLRSRELTVDELNNALIYQGDSEAWGQLLTIIKEMDRPARMVLLEVTLAEVTLTEGEELGVEWVLKGSIDNYKLKLGTLKGLGIGSSGLAGVVLNGAGETLAALNAFANNSRVKILSTPRVMVKSGAKASVDVGTEVPTITSQATSSELVSGGTSAILQSIQYRKTGVILSVSPVIHSGDRIDLEISQEVSASQPNTTTTIQSPNIQTRKIETSLQLKDGGSILLGGLISTNVDKSTKGVPFLSNIPNVGRLFRVDHETTTRTDMIMLIVPYIIDSDQEAVSVTDSLRKRLHIE